MHDLVVSEARNWIVAFCGLTWVSVLQK